MTYTNGDAIAYTFDQLRDAVRECTSYDLVQRFSEDDDVYDYITNNDQVNAYLNALN